MPTVADEFIVKLSVDGSGISKGAKDAEKSVDTLKKGTKEAGEASKRAGKDGADAFAAFRREAVGALALFTGGKSLAGFTKDITQANVALSNLSQQLGIAPQKLTQLHYAMGAIGGKEGSVDSFLKSIQAKSSNADGLRQLSMLSGVLGVSFLDAHKHVRGDIIEQLNGSKQFRGMSRAIQDNYIAQLGGNDDIANLATRNDLPNLIARFKNMGPTRAQIAQAQQLLADWTELKANTDKIMQQVFSDLEPKLHTFIHALIELEKTHPDTVAKGVGAVATALTLLSAALTARGIMSLLKLVAGISSSSGGVALAVGGAAEYARETTGHSPWDQYGGNGSLFLKTPDTLKKTDEKESGITDKEAFNHYISRAGERRLEDWLEHWFGVSLPSPNKDIERSIMMREKESGITDKEAINHAKKRAWLPWLTDTTTDAVERERQLMLQERQQPSSPTSHPTAQNIDFERLTGAVAMQESAGNPFARSKAGAMGLMQLMPATARGLGVSNPFDANQSWEAGGRYLSSLVKRYKNVEKALAAYNWGSGNLNRDMRDHGDAWRSYLPKETSDYLNKVGRNYATNHVVHHHQPINVSVQSSNAQPHEIAHAVKAALSQDVSHQNRNKMG